MKQQRRYKILGGSLLGLIFSLVVSATAVAQETATGGGYLLKPGDVLAITVWKEEDLKLEVLVRPDGHFSYPLAGDVMAAGRTVNEIQSELKQKIEPFIPDVELTVLVQQILGNTGYVIGKVNNPGPFVMMSDTSVMQALSIAGGTTTFASLKNIVILRTQNGSQSAIPFNYAAVENGDSLEQNIILQAGDVVVVP